jgi:hypothetical protein
MLKKDKKWNLVNVKKKNAALIWLLLAGIAMGFSLSLIAAYFLGFYFLIPVFILMVICGYLTSRLIGRAGGELNENAKSFSIILEGFVFGLAIDLFRLRFDYIIDVFKYIALGSSFVLMAMTLKRHYETYLEEHSGELHPVIMRKSVLYLLAGLNFAITVNCLVAAFLNFNYYIPLLVGIIGLGVYLVFSSKAEHDLLASETRTWTQLFAGVTIGFAYDLLVFRGLIWQDILKLVVVTLTFGVIGHLIRSKDEEHEAMTSSEGIKLELASKKEQQKSRVAKRRGSRKSKSSKRKKKKK